MQIINIPDAARSIDSYIVIDIVIVPTGDSAEARCERQGKNVEQHTQICTNIHTLDYRCYDRDNAIAPKIKPVCKSNNKILMLINKN